MIDLLSLLKSTNAYKIINSDKQQGRLSHAYLIVCADKDNLKGYMTGIAKLLFCNDEEPCQKCRNCLSIEQGVYPDAEFFPKGEKGVLSEDVNELVKNTYIKPYESDKRAFFVCDAQTMNLSSQNKLLKTLEEPPKNVYIFLGATSEFPLLPTVRSRVKKLEIPAFSSEQLFDTLKTECTDIERLKSAITCADGSLGKTLWLYNDQNFKTTLDYAVDVIVNMQSSKDVLTFQSKFNKLKIDVKEFLSVLNVLLRDLIIINRGEEQLAFNLEHVSLMQGATGYKLGSLLAIQQDVIDAVKRLEANSSTNMVLEWLLFKILEEKFKWQKL